MLNFLWPYLLIFTGVPIIVEGAVYKRLSVTAALSRGLAATATSPWRVRWQALEEVYSGMGQGWMGVPRRNGGEQSGKKRPWLLYPALVSYSVTVQVRGIGKHSGATKVWRWKRWIYYSGRQFLKSRTGSCTVNPQDGWIQKSEASEPKEQG